MTDTEFVEQFFDIWHGGRSQATRIQGVSQLAQDFWQERPEFSPHLPEEGSSAASEAPAAPAPPPAPAPSSASPEGADANP